MKPRLLSWLVLIVLVGSACPAQTILWEITSPNSTPGSGPLADPNFGELVQSLKDVDNDGIDDLVASSSNAPNGSMIQAGYVGVYSGATGAFLYGFHGQFAGALLRLEGSVGDVDADGAGDFVIGFVPQPGGLLIHQLISGSTGAVISNLYGIFFFPGGDLNQDGIGDFVGNGPTLVAYAGPTGQQVLFSIPPQAFNFCQGYHRITPVGDRNGDSIPDLVVDWSGICNQACVSPSGNAYLCSGLDGEILQTFSGIGTCDFLGGFGIEALDDLDGDGVGDFIMTAHGLGQAAVYSGGSSALMQTFSGAPGFFGKRVGALGDVDGDGYPDYGIWDGGSSIQIRSGHSGTVLNTLSDPTATYLLGFAFDGVGDLNGDGYPEVVVGLPRMTGIGDGKVRMYSLAPQGVTSFQSGCPIQNGVVPRIAANRSANVGQTIDFSVSRVLPNQNVALILGLSNTSYGSVALPWSLGPDGLPGCNILVSIDEFVPLQTVQVTPGKGAVTYSLTIPNIPGLTGMPFYAQWGVENLPNASNIGGMSGGLQIVIQ